MTNPSTVELPSTPRMRDLYLRAFAGSLPVPLLTARSAQLPTTTVRLPGVRIDRANLAAFTTVCGLPLADTLPLTYPYVLANPVTMSLMVSRTFPFALPGLVHLGNVIEQRRPIGVDETLTVAVHVENLRDHRRGKVFDAISEVSAGAEPVWRQTATLLKQQGKARGRRSATAEPQAPAASQETIRVDQRVIDAYAAASGDHNPIHVSRIGARILGFPGTIAHGMWEAAAVLRAVTGVTGESSRYEVTFGKPLLLPGTVELFVDHPDDAGGWHFSLRDARTGATHLTATLAQIA
ncbi:MaoC/PaaZ C-terminal domain-containing protein [Nocardia sp. NPDC051570]|uniref:MaoC/PaaZ C-terminal domain-containing protein n=1 Tax=Nocardia sp. NPDC051570 TaxID=3364324 RepID=UPI00378B150E